MFPTCQSLCNIDMSNSSHFFINKFSIQMDDVKSWFRAWPDSASLLSSNHSSRIVSSGNNPLAWWYPPGLQYSLIQLKATLRSFGQDWLRPAENRWGKCVRLYWTFIKRIGLFEPTYWLDWQTRTWLVLCFPGLPQWLGEWVERLLRSQLWDPHYWLWSRLSGFRIA